MCYKNDPLYRLCDCGNPCDTPEEVCSSCQEYDAEEADFGDDNHVAFFDEVFGLEDGFDPDGYTEQDYRDLMDRI